MTSKYIDLLCPEKNNTVSSTEKLNEIIEEALIKELQEENGVENIKEGNSPGESKPQEGDSINVNGKKQNINRNNYNKN